MVPWFIDMDKFSNNYTVPEKERTIEVNTRNVKCALDHPVVYYVIGESSHISTKQRSNSVECGYCGMKYVYK